MVSASKSVQQWDLEKFLTGQDFSNFKNNNVLKQILYASRLFVSLWHCYSFQILSSHAFNYPFSKGLWAHSSFPKTEGSFHCRQSFFQSLAGPQANHMQSESFPRPCGAVNLFQSSSESATDHFAPPVRSLDGTN